jgi:glycogen operon protein
MTDDDFLLLFNADGGAMDFTIPAFGRAKQWSVVLDTNEPELEDGARRHAPGESLTMEGRSMVVLQAVQPEG